jgi:hypothetical protein
VEQVKMKIHLEQPPMELQAQPTQVAVAVRHLILGNAAVMAVQEL